MKHKWWDIKYHWYDVDEDGSMSMDGDNGHYYYACCDYDDDQSGNDNDGGVPAPNSAGLKEVQHQWSMS